MYNRHRELNDLAAAHYTLILVISEAAFVANSHQGCGPDVGVANGTFAIAFIAEPADGNTRLLPAHNEIAVLDVSMGIVLVL